MNRIRRWLDTLRDARTGLAAAVVDQTDLINARLALTETGWRNVGRPVADDIRDLAAAWAQAERRASTTETKTTAGVGLSGVLTTTSCAANVRRRPCRSPVLPGFHLCWNHADDDARFANDYGKYLAEMAVGEWYPASGHAHARRQIDVTKLHAQVEVRRRIADGASRSDAIDRLTPPERRIYETYRRLGLSEAGAMEATIGSDELDCELCEWLRMNPPPLRAPGVVGDPTEEADRG